MQRLCGPHSDVPYGLVTWKQKRKVKICTNIPWGTCKWSASFWFKRSKVKVNWRQKPKEIAAYWPSAGGSGANCKLGLIIVLHLIYSRRSRHLATGQTKAYHVGTRRRRFFLLLQCNQCSICQKTVGRSMTGEHQSCKDRGTAGVEGSRVGRGGYPPPQGVGIPLPSLLSGLGESHELLQRGLGRIPARKCIFSIFRVTEWL